MDIITTYVTALAPAAGALLTAIIMFVRIIASVRGMVNDCRKQTDGKQLLNSRPVKPSVNSDGIEFILLHIDKLPLSQLL